MPLLPNALVAIIIGFIAVLAAMRFRRDLASLLGREWRVRFILVQGVIINVLLFGTVCLLIGKDTTYEEQWCAVFFYAPLFYSYSLMNMKWTAKKFHGVEA